MKIDIEKLHPSFYYIVRQHRNDPEVSDDQFIGALINSVGRSAVERQECGHGVDHVIEDGKCEICQTLRDFVRESEIEWGEHLNDEAAENAAFGDD